MNSQRGRLGWMSGQTQAEGGWEVERQVRAKIMFGSCLWQLYVDFLLNPFRWAAA